MTKAEALNATHKRYTNLIDGKVLSGISVHTIIAFYEAMMVNEPVKVVQRSGILDNFKEDEINELEEEEDYY